MGGMKGGMKMDTSHLNPMPNLMRVFKQMPEKLNLTPEQIEKLKAEIKTQAPKIKDFLEAVRKNEKDLLNATLADKPLSDLDQLASNIMQERLNVINSEAGFSDTLKKIMNADQFANLIKIYKEKFAKKPHYADNMQGKMAMLKHVNPMPNLIFVVDKMSGKLNLSDKQAMKLKQWRDERKPIMEKQFKAIIQLEGELQDSALNQAAPEKLAELADGIMQNRMKVVRGKAFCRDKIKSILNPEQYKKVLELYKANFM